MGCTWVPALQELQVEALQGVGFEKLVLWVGLNGKEEEALVNTGEDPGASGRGPVM